MALALATECEELEDELSVQRATVAALYAELHRERATTAKASQVLAVDCFDRVQDATDRNGKLLDILERCTYAAAASPPAGYQSPRMVNATLPAVPSLGVPRGSSSVGRSVRAQRGVATATVSHERGVVRRKAREARGTVPAAQPLAVDALEAAIDEVAAGASEASAFDDVEDEPSMVDETSETAMTERTALPPEAASATHLDGAFESPPRPAEPNAWFLPATAPGSSLAQLDAQLRVSQSEFWGM